VSEAFEAAFARLPQAQRTQRSAAWQAFRETGLPRKHAEDWRYTELSGLTQAPFLPAPLMHPGLPGLAGAETLAFVNGYCAEGSLALVMPMEPAPLRCGISALNGALASDGLNLRVAPGTSREPLYLVTWFGGTDKGMAHLRHRIELGAHARAVIVLHELGDAAPFFATQVFDLELGAGARLDLYRVQQPGRATQVITRLDARLSRDATFNCASLHGGSALARHDVNVRLDGPGAGAELHGLLVPAAGAHLDVHTRLDHVATHGRSRERYRALVPAGARASFNGKVIVHRGAQKTDSEQHVDSLLLAPGAEINAKPELQIDADDVKCAHGATCGQLDEDALYYLRARGIALPEARALLLGAFAGEIVQRYAFEPARALAQQVLGASLSS
jgi:Fe-S cluster assembly protein SufD